MNSYVRRNTLLVTWACIAVLPASFRALALERAEGSSSVATSVLTARNGHTTASASADDDGQNVSIEATDTTTEDGPAVNRNTAWLGISTREASEDLTSQLDLEAGVGLVVTYVGPDSPAAKAGLKKHDVLVQFDDQALVHPAQLRKLVRVHKQGDQVKLTFYRGGKKETASVTLGKTDARLGAFQDEGGLQGNLQALQDQLRDLHLDESMGKMKIDQKKVQEEIRRSMEQAGRALHEALRTATNADYGLNPVRKMLENLANSNMFVDQNASVTVRSTGKGVKSLVNTDDSGTIILVNQPKLHLTAHDKDGRLIFDGEIETADQRAKVPHDLWERVEPLLEKMEANPPDQSEKQEEDK